METSRKTNWLRLALLFVVFVACEARRPKGVLAEEEMVQVLIEVYVAEEKTSRLALQTDSARQVFGVMKGKVYDKTGVSDSVFKKSYQYYMDRPKQLERIYSALVDSLNLRSQRASVRDSGE